MLYQCRKCPLKSFCVVYSELHADNLKKIRVNLELNKTNIKQNAMVMYETRQWAQQGNIVFSRRAYFALPLCSGELHNQYTHFAFNVHYFLLFPMLVTQFRKGHLLILLAMKVDNQGQRKKDRLVTVSLSCWYWVLHEALLVTRGLCLL